MSRLSTFEIESYIRGLSPMPIASVGSESWMIQHDRLEQLNIQAHAEAVGKHDEYVVEQFVDQSKIQVLIHELIVIESWKAHVFPLLLSHFSPITSVKAYIVLYHEATICNLLEVLLYHASVCEVGGDAMLELVDYCARKMNALNTGVFKSIQVVAEDEKASTKAMLESDTATGLKRQSIEIGFAVCVCTSSLLRFLTDHIPVLALGVVGRMLHTHDILLALVPIVESPPWTRRRDSNGTVEKFTDQRWIVIAPRDLPLMTKLEGQVWLTIYNLMMDVTCRKQYQYNTHRKDVLIRLRRFFTDILVDQLPMLRELKRFIEELSILQPPPPTASSLAFVEVVPEMRDSILANADWPSIAADQLRTVFANDDAARQRDIARLAATYNMESFESALPAPNCGECGATNDAMKRCSRCKNEWYCGKVCQVKAWKKHQKVCDMMVKDQPNATTTSKPAASASAAAATKAASASSSSSSSSASSSSVKPSSSAAKPSSSKPSASVPSSAPAPAAASTPSPAAAAPVVSSSSSPSSSFAPSISASSLKPEASIVSTATAVMNKKIVMLDDMD